MNEKKIDCRDCKNRNMCQIKLLADNFYDKILQYSYFFRTEGFILTCIYRLWQDFVNDCKLFEGE